MKINLSWRIQDAFNWMPLVGLIGGRILCMHGGISPQIQNIDQLRQLHRPQDPPNPSIGIDLLWLVNERRPPIIFTHTFYTQFMHNVHNAHRNNIESK